MFNTIMLDPNLNKTTGYNFRMFKRIDFYQFNI